MTFHKPSLFCVLLCCGLSLGFGLLGCGGSGGDDDGVDNGENLCDGINCGEHGSCVDGVCTCTDGYSGADCSTPPIITNPCDEVDCGDHGNCVDGICACDAGYEGDSCEVDVDECEPGPCLNGGACAEGAPGTYECTCVDGYTGDTCEIEPGDLPPSVTYTEIEAGRLAPTGCDTYIGAHLLYPGELLCCSAPSAGSAPVCAPGDTPDIPCVIELEFCDDGTASQAWSPDPKTGYPGHTVSTSGSWSVDPDTGALEITTTSSALGGAMITVSTETYSNAFTYDNGTKLDLNSAAAVTIDSAGIGLYHRDHSMITDISGLWSANLDIDMITDLTVTATGYDSTYVQDVVCTPPMGMVCLVVPKSEEINTSGTHTQPIELYITPSGAKMFQTAEAKALVFERQPDPCDEIACGEHGVCEDGVCLCTGGYTGEFCDVPGPCVGIECGNNATCVEGVCKCDAGYEGDSCEVDTNECDPSPCLNGGSCAEGVPGTYACTCIDGYAGDNCERCPTDADGDGYGDPASASCAHPELDCDDHHATVYPGAPELCDGLDNQCAGDTGYGSIDEGYGVCADMVSIPSGCFDMGDGFAEGWPDELPVHHVCISAFEMDIHEITNAEYAECVAAGACTAPSSSSSYSRETYYGDPAYSDYPVIWMEWHQVDEYCAWAGKRLPTEAEWEYAARGSLAGKRYPWGDTISSTDANYDFNIGDTTMVESYEPNGYGLYDMAGNVWEWVADWFNETYYSVSPANNPTGPASGMAPVRRGGSWDHSPYGLRVAVRCDFCHADRHGNNLGGRCARDGGCVAIDEDGDGYGKPADVDCIYRELDCDDTNPEVNPGIKESNAAGNCGDGIDNDCDGTIDDCGGPWSAAPPPADASIYGSNTTRASGMFNHLANLLLIPLGLIISLRVLRRRK